MFERGYGAGGNKEDYYVIVLCRVGFVTTMGARADAVVEALRYKPEGRGIDSR
jgi:hypothetical protein